ncbi:hypothetical protein ACFVOR_14765 [Streptomyces sp. NPDC057837]|uniref:hypothetical protein n=1 Tax=Streptomyces sp. NPDC057837 TaxID=3346260 RepID=UPI0036AC674D
MNPDAYALAGLALILGLSIGWCWGHSTARVRHVPVGATQAQDDAALWAHDRARAEDLLAQLDPPNVDSDDGESPFGWREMPKPKTSQHTEQ